MKVAGLVIERGVRLGGTAATAAVGASLERAQTEAFIAEVEENDPETAAEGVLRAASPSGAVAGVKRWEDG